MPTKSPSRSSTPPCARGSTQPSPPPRGRSSSAALALGGSRQSDAVEVLLESWPQARGLEYRQALLRALSISRHERAIEFLKQLAAEGRPQDAADARAALALFPEKHGD